MHISHFRGVTILLMTVCQLVIFASCREDVSKVSKVKVLDSLPTAQGNDFAPIDQSPLDITYCPQDFPQKKMSNTAATSAPVGRVIYSRPHKKGRKIFGADSSNICPYGQAWRLGANESTEIAFFSPVVINGENINPGRYIMYCIPEQDKWVIVFNSNLNSWGLNIDPSKDIFKVEVPVQVQSPAVEDFTIVFQETVTGSDMVMIWDNVKVFLPITYSR